MDNKLTKEIFSTNYNLDLTGIVEEKGDKVVLKYISWANAWKMLKEQDPTATFEYIENANGGFEFQAGKGFMVKTKVTAFGMTLSMALPIMDNRNNSKTTIDARDISDSLMRCLVKNIAMFGIGLPLYVGEDLEQFITPEPVDLELSKKQKIKNELIDSIKQEYADIKKTGEEAEKFASNVMTTTLRSRKITELTVDELEMLRKTLVDGALQKGYIK